MVLAVIKLRRVFVALLIIGFFLFFLNVLGPALFTGPSRDYVHQQQWLEVEERELNRGWNWKDGPKAAQNQVCPVKNAHSDVQVLWSSSLPE
jgi:hypothetical protein